MQLLLTGGTNSEMCIKSSKLLPTCGAWCALIRNLLECFFGKIDGVISSISLRTRFKMISKLLIRLVTEGTISKGISERVVHGG